MSFYTWGNSGIEPYSGSANQLSRNRQGPPTGLAIMEDCNGALCRTGRIAEADSDLYGEPGWISRARGGDVCMTRGPSWVAKSVRNVRDAGPSASAHPPTRRRRTVTKPGRCLFSAGLWRRRSTMGPLGSPSVASILQTASSRRSTTIDEKCHPRPHHRPAA
jgi:hypothetical protein